MARSTSPFISISRRGSTGGDPETRTVLWLRGDHDITTKVSVAVGIARAAQRDDMPVLIDLSAVTFMDASTVGAIVASRNRLRSRGQSLEVRAPSRPAVRILELCGLAHLIQLEAVHPSGAAPSLGTWVDVTPIEPLVEIEHEDGREAAREWEAVTSALESQVMTEQANGMADAILSGTTAASALDTPPPPKT